jgi:hypothetical protein
MKYEVEFEYVTAVTIEVEADGIAEARTKAIAAFEQQGSDSLPEMWPSDFVAVAIRAEDGNAMLLSPEVRS